MLSHYFSKSRGFTFWLFAFVACLYFLFPNPRPDFTEFNSHDSESYLALSKNLIERNEYTRNLSGEYIAHTLWPPGMPVLLAPAVILSGDTINWYLVKYTVIAISLFGLFLVWQYIYSLTEKRSYANFTLLFLALNPYYWHFSRIALSEIVTFVWIVFALLLIHKTWNKEDPYNIKIAVLGFVCGLGMLIKGMVIGLAFAPLVYFIYDLKRLRLDSKLVLRYSIYFLTFFITFGLWSYRNSYFDTTHLGLDGVNQIQMLFKTVVEDPNSRFRTIPELITTAKENLLWHAIYNVTIQTIPATWMLDLKSVNIGQYIALFFTALVLFLSNPLRIKNVPAFLIMSPIVVMLFLMVIGGSERYWISISFLLCMCVVINLSDFFESLKKRSSFLTDKLNLALTVGLPIVLLVQLSSLLLYIHKFEQSPFNSREDYPKFAELVLQLDDFCVGENSPELVIKTRNNHAVELISGCEAPMHNAALSILPDYNSEILQIDNQPVTEKPYDILLQNDTWALVAYH